MSPSLRKVSLTAHVAVSVGWLGAVAVFLAIAVVGLTSDDPQTVRGAYLVMDPAAQIVLVPLAVASLATGLLQGFLTPWGVIRHYWVVFKLAINVFATIVLLLYLETFRSMADVAADPGSNLETVQTVSPALHAVAAFVLLLAATVLSVFKPRGVTRFGRRTRTGDARRFVCRLSERGVGQCASSTSPSNWATARLIRRRRSARPRRPRSP